MADKEIQSGADVVSKFLQGIEGAEGVDSQTLEAVKALAAENKLGKNTLLKSLQTNREEDNTSGKD